MVGPYAVDQEQADKKQWVGEGEIEKQKLSHTERTNTRKNAGTGNKDKLAQREGGTETRYTRRRGDNETQVQHIRAGQTISMAGNTGGEDLKQEEEAE